MIRSALTISLPILFGFVPLGIAFGLLFQELGYPWYFASLMAIFVYAGAAQFMAIGLLSSGIGLLEIAISTFFLNSRHMFYGLAFLESFGNWNLRKLYLIFGLTDETYALMTTIKVPKKFTKERYYFFITLFAQFYWVVGCTIGALTANALSFNTNGMEFAATALFVVLLMSMGEGEEVAAVCHRIHLIYYCFIIFYKTYAFGCHYSFNRINSFIAINQNTV